MRKTDDYRNLEDAYRYYRKHQKKDTGVRMYEFIRLMGEFNKLMMDHITNGDVIELPAHMGVMYIRGRQEEARIEDGKIKGLAPDWKKSRMYFKEHNEWKIIYHRNIDGIRYRFQWSRRNVYAPYKNMYAFRATRKNKRSLHDKICNDGIEFIIE